MRKRPDPHYRHRFQAELVSHAIWLYHVFSLSFRDVELILAERGVIVSYESIWRWCLKFGASFASSLRRRRTTSPVEGQISRLKMLKRTMYGCAGFQLLRASVMNAA
jgi:putative transposase